MYINKVISFNSSWNLFLQKTKAYADICSAISDLNKTTLSDPDLNSPPYRDSRNNKIEITPFTFNRVWERLVADLGWASYRMKSDTPGGINLFVRHFKEGVAAKVMATDRLMFPNWVLVESPRITGSDYCDLSVLIVPMESVNGIYHDYPRMGPHFYFEKALAQLNDLMPINQKTPFLVIGISLEEEDVEIIELSSTGSDNLIERVLEFPKEHYQAGVGILSYFGEIIKQKYPDIDAKVRIEQDGNTVRMIVDSPCGSRDIIEKTLEEYALVITKKATPESLLEDRIQIQQLTNKLQMAELEVKQTVGLLKLTEKYADCRIKSLEDNVVFLRQQIGEQMRHIGTSQNIILHQSRKEEKLMLVQMDHNKRTLEELIQDSCTRMDLKVALQSLKAIIENGAKPEQEDEAKNYLRLIRHASPETFDDLAEALKNTMYGVSGNVAFQWLQQICAAIA